jgi:hypothetical protein
MLGLSGCEKAKVTNEAAADVFVKSIVNAQGATVYAVIHSVFSYTGISSVSVTGPDGTTTQLTDLEGSGDSFYNNPVEADYLSAQPTASVGSYTYLVIFKDGEEKTYTNSLSTATLLPAIITSLVKSTDGSTVDISWDAITNVHAYQLKIMKGTTQVNSTPLFTSPLKLSVPITSFNQSGPGTYTFEVTGFLFETTAYDYLQAISVSTSDIAL